MSTFVIQISSRASFGRAILSDLKKLRASLHFGRTSRDSSRSVHFDIKTKQNDRAAVKERAKLPRAEIEFAYSMRRKNRALKTRRFSMCRFRKFSPTGDTSPSCEVARIPSQITFASRARLIKRISVSFLLSVCTHIKLFPLNSGSHRSLPRAPGSFSRIFPHNLSPDTLEPRFPPTCLPSRGARWHEKKNG